MRVTLGRLVLLAERAYPEPLDLTLEDMARRVKLPVRTLSDHLKRLREAGKLTTEPVGGPRKKGESKLRIHLGRDSRPDDTGWLVSSPDSAANKVRDAIAEAAHAALEASGSDIKPKTLKRLYREANPGKRGMRAVRLG